jgi:hypothetical protein
VLRRGGTAGHLRDRPTSTRLVGSPILRGLEALTRADIDKVGAAADLRTTARSAAAVATSSANHALPR